MKNREVRKLCSVCISTSRSATSWNDVFCVGTTV